ncbi:hypothetical protein AVEN_172177-1 [Araneus ventricosus]|uniref:Uncharacterized protein n=1 Tax=Araneus ventricosus TaxID=182803 RepID=A0A4Y2JR40_ARAVE|nr:hypothetical protein AVEN_172177-1 [Araneus ventricosus]
MRTFPKHNTATTSLCMTCCTREEQLFAWQTAYLDTTINVMNEKWGFIRPGSRLFTHPWSSLDIPGPTVGVDDDDAWLTEAHEWDICCTVPYPTVSAELCVPKHLLLYLHSIGLSAEPQSGADFALPSGTVSDVRFL